MKSFERDSIVKKRTLANRVRHRLVRAKKFILSNLRQIHFQSNADWRNTIFLAGTGRSGTTWISDVINYDNAYRFIMEPFSARHVPISHSFARRPYIRPADTSQRYLGPANTILAGTFRNAWTDYYNRRLLSDKRLIKEIRAHCFLHWLHCRFPSIPKVLLLRHPCAVAHSWMNVSWTDDLDAFLGQPELMADFLEPFRDRLEKTSDPFDRIILHWCVENWIPLQQFRRGEIHLAFYEEFCSRPESALKGLFEHLDRPIGDGVFAKLRTPSSQVRKCSAILINASTTDSWRQFVSRTQLRRALEILSWFGLDAIYGEDSKPNSDAAYGMLAGGTTVAPIERTALMHSDTD